MVKSRHLWVVGGLYKARKNILSPFLDGAVVAESGVTYQVTKDSRGYLWLETWFKGETTSKFITHFDIADFKKVG